MITKYNWEGGRKRTRKSKLGEERENNTEKTGGETDNRCSISETDRLRIKLTQNGTKKRKKKKSKRGQPKVLRRKMTYKKNPKEGGSYSPPDQTVWGKRHGKEGTQPQLYLIRTQRGKEEATQRSPREALKRRIIPRKNSPTRRRIYWKEVGGGWKE